MKIQIISGRRLEACNQKVVVSDYSKPVALDDFDINVIDLSYEGVWRWNGSTPGAINIYDDFKSISVMAEGSKKSIIIYAFPQNLSYKYLYDGCDYRKSEKLKSIICEYNIKGYQSVFPYGNMPFELIYEYTNTNIGEWDYSADFHFNNIDDEFIVSKSKTSEKVTTIKLSNNLYFTTLNICTSINKSINFIKHVFFGVDEQSIPKWVDEFVFGDDLEQRQLIEKCDDEIIELKRRIEAAEDKLSENRKYKSILYSNGELLVKVVFEILEILLECDLSKFVDEYKEDFLIQNGAEVYIGEIKGITSNVKSEHISQLEVHYQTYIDNINDDKEIQHVHSLLIINPLRTKELSQREPVHDRQIQLAQRNKSLIIETITLLKIFESYQKGLITSDDCQRVLSNKIGLLTLLDFEVLDVGGSDNEGNISIS